MKHLYQLSLDITLIAPWLVHGNDPGKFGLDATLLRDHCGRPILPGTLLQGRLRDAWTEMHRDFALPVPAPDLWFGRPGDEAEARGRLWVDDLVMVGELDEVSLSTRVPIDPDSGAARQGMLLMIEQSCPPGTPVGFSGIWRAWLDPAEAQSIAQAIQAGLRWHSQLGAQRSIGFGRVAAVTVKAERIACAAPRQVPDAERLRLTLVPAVPLCVGTRSRGGNVFTSSDIISGGTIKGAIATQLRQQYGKSLAELRRQSKLAEHFDALSVTHALPARDQRRPAALPLSLAAVGETLYDLSEWPTPQLIEGQAPAFSHDWKTPLWVAAADAQSWGHTRSYLRVRTAIDAQTRTANENKLFAYECRVAEGATRWLADIDLGAIPAADRNTVIGELATLLHAGLGPIGKTDAWATASLSADLDQVWQRNPVTGKRVVMQLNTPALLIASRQVADQASPDLAVIYRALFAHLSGNSLQLSHYFASHSMSGGAFLGMRRGASGRRPYVLTDAGSVFVFAVNDQATAAGILAAWQGQGLPLSEAVCEEAGNDWQRNPYLPQNGYGEIAVNLQHGFVRPSAARLTPCFGSEPA